MDLIIKNGKVVTAEKTLVADVGIEKGKIKAIGKNIKCACPDVKIIDAKGMLVMPGGVDVHVHLNLFVSNTCSEEWDTATAGAACGGVTTVIDFAYQELGGSLKKAVEDRQADASGKVCIDYSLHAGITDWNDNVKTEMNTLVEEGITSFKMHMDRKEGCMSDDGMLFQALEETRKNGALIMVHAENAFVLELLIARYRPQTKTLGAWAHALSRPCFIEYEAIQRAITWAEVTKGLLYIVHVSTGEGVEVIKQGKKRGVNVWAETCPQYLLLTDEVYKRKDGHLYACCPPIRTKHDKERLWEGIIKGEIQVIATDSCAFTKKQKDAWEGDFTKIPYGLPGAELRIPTMWSAFRKRKISMNKFVSLVATNPAKLFGLYPQKGTVEMGSDADIVIFDPKKKVTVDWRDLVSKCDWTPYQGMELTGYPVITILRGEVIAKDGKFVGKVGRGRFLGSSPIFYGTGRGKGSGLSA
ncbi:dihydropyrimidinase [Candidatus Hakubella thermalkaliphila]|uniref:Dihydropyrimidinase n=2 Tax=Candidatus Hakubella thermalkaliphila TaxID=2754717 RepID=A0A6V8NE61_9ACTN|nr:dihydropyrimidinase [Candidatus Hakubella thermalkaliphila]GFP18542.1 dihydropyrimidinase [Candidatus Hakubella thermalkaliphila]GFP23013.1 dihydropyrimidinase [Candidatus Hakubella thermalkaliphila]GFP30925.1 dihydropyrimidinase [Candidatus Hakubella thermalkaliphila]GFP37706.1 dihydropyrimidinase [Candidatus Hakubella thermalkaliphila]